MISAANRQTKGKNNCVKTLFNWGIRMEKPSIYNADVWLVDLLLLMQMKLDESDSLASSGRMQLRIKIRLQIECRLSYMSAVCWLSSPIMQLTYFRFRQIDTKYSLHQRHEHRINSFLQADAGRVSGTLSSRSTIFTLYNRRILRKSDYISSYR